MTSDTVRITAQTKLKHTTLLRASRSVGGIDNLADMCGVSKTTMFRMVHLQKAPPETETPAWPKEKLDRLKQQLEAVTGQSYSSLFPKQLRDAIALNEIGRVIEAERDIPLRGLIEYAEASAPRFALPSPVDVAIESERAETVSEAMSTLSWREQEIVKMRNGLGEFDGREHTYEQIANRFRIGRERVRQIECRAYRRLQCTHGYRLRQVMNTD